MIWNTFGISSYILSWKLLDTYQQSFFSARTACDFFPQFSNSGENVNSQEAVCCYADDEYTKDDFKTVYCKIVYRFELVGKENIPFKFLLNSPFSGTKEYVLPLRVNS